MIDQSAPKVALTGGDEKYLNKNQTLTFTVTDDYGLDSNYIKLDVYYKTYDKLSGNWILDNSGVKTNTSADGRKIVISYNMTQKGQKATMYYFTISGIDRVGRNIVVTKPSDILNKLKESSGYMSQHYYLDSTKPQLVKSYFSLVLEDGTEIPYNKTGDYGYFNQNVSVSLKILEQFLQLLILIKIEPFIIKI